MFADEDLHRHAVENLNQADALLFGRVTYEMMQAAWRLPARTGARPDWMEPFARTIDAAKKYVVSSTLNRVDWNAELVRGDLGKAVQQLKRESGKGLFMGGVKLPLALAELGLIDEYEFVVQPRLAGHGPTLFAGLSKCVDLRLVSRLEFGSGAVAMRYEPRGSPKTGHRGSLQNRPTITIIQDVDFDARLDTLGHLVVGDGVRRQNRPRTGKTGQSCRSDPRFWRGIGIPAGGHSQRIRRP